MEILGVVSIYTKVGNLLGLEGKFCTDFGFDQIKQTIKEDQEDIEKAILEGDTDVILNL